MSINLFITGTDTGVGKTHISIGLLKTFSSLGHSTLGIKPLATGCMRKGNSLYNEDAIALQKASSIQLDYDHINPFRFEPAIAPHIAAAQTNTSLSVETIMAKTKYGLNYPADIRIVEGVGGWHVPLNDTETMADFVTHCNLSVILVVGIRLGCLNHAILTYEAIKNKKIYLAGWAANFFDPQQEKSSHIIDTLKTWLKIPFLGTIDFNKQFENQFLLKNMYFI